MKTKINFISFNNTTSNIQEFDNRATLKHFLTERLTRYDAIKRVNYEKQTKYEKKTYFIRPSLL